MPRNLTPPIAADPESPQRWKVVGLELAHQCAFCGAPSEATVGCPDETTPLIFQVGVCNSCLVDSVLQRFREVRYQRTVRLARDMNAAADEIVKLRNQARWNNRDPAETRAEELRIREKVGLLEDTPLHDVTTRGSPLL
jgi:hypothetical protein